jgi:drug/metabolite transporter (DMT)-like permease
LGDRYRLWAAVATVALAVTIVHVVPIMYRLLPTPGALSSAQAACAVAIIGCVPETSNQMGFIFVLVGAGLVIEVITGTQLPQNWHMALAVVVLWSGVYGATGRQSALVGALFAMWPLVIVPLALRIVRRGEHVSEAVCGVVVGLGAIAAVVVSRTGALNQSVWPAVVAVCLAGPTSLALGVLIVKRRMSPERGASGNVAP